MTESKPMRRVVDYARVSSDDQRQRETIRTQFDVLDRRREQESDVVYVRRYTDDGVSGTIPLSQREGGSLLFADAAAGKFDELWVYKFDRLGREAVDLLLMRTYFEEHGVRIVSMLEGDPGLLGYGVSALVADDNRREFLRRSADGMERAAREGRYVGGVVPYGLMVVGTKPNARLAIDERVVWGDRTAADIIRWIYALVAYDRLSGRAVADKLNQLGVPTWARKEGRGVRARATQGVWRAGRINQIVKNTTYRGEHHYGQRSNKPGREIISVSVPAVVSDALWEAAQAAMQTRRRPPADQRRRYDFGRGLIRCGVCGLNYTGTTSHGDDWYRCNGQINGRGRLEGHCHGKSIKGTWLGPIVRSDIERFLSNPGDLLDELAEELASEPDAFAAVAAAQLQTLETELERVESQQNQLLTLYIDPEQRLPRDVLVERSEELEKRRAAISHELQKVRAEMSECEAPAPIDRDLLEELKRRVEEGLSDDQWYEVIGALVGQVTVHTTLVDGRKQARVAIEYRFSNPTESVVETRTGIRADIDYGAPTRTLVLPTGRRRTP